MQSPLCWNLIFLDKKNHLHRYLKCPVKGWGGGTKNTAPKIKCYLLSYKGRLKKIERGRKNVKDKINKYILCFMVTKKQLS